MHTIVWGRKSGPIPCFWESRFVNYQVDLYDNSYETFGGVIRMK